MIPSALGKKKGWEAHIKCKIRRNFLQYNWSALTAANSELLTRRKTKIASIKYKKPKPL